MSVIQKIQEKYAKLMAIIIALALIIFVVMLAFENGGNMFRGGSSTTVGKVNGEKIDALAFSQKVDQQEKTFQQQYQASGAAVRQQALETVWNQEVSRIIMTGEQDKLGMQIGKRELGDILYGANPPQDLRQSFTDPATGIYNGQEAKLRINEMLNSKQTPPEQKAQMNAYFNYLEASRLNEKYTSLLTNTINYPKWLIEKQNADNSQIANISVVREFYTSIPDSTVTVSDKEIEDYVSKHKKDYPQEESRSIAYVAFSALPTGVDSASTLDQLVTLKPEFDTTTDVASLVARNGSEIPYSETYFAKSQLQSANLQMQALHKDTILSLPKNAVYGPYLDGSAYVLAKMIDSKMMPDSVKSRHILLGTVDRQGQPIMPDSVAKAKVDSIEMAIRNGANFDTLNQRYSTDEVSKAQKGEMTISSTDLQTRFAPEYTQFVLFDGKPGDKKVVKTQFGWHYIEIMNFIKPEPHFKVAYLAKRIEPSVETDNNANSEATMFASTARDQKSFDANAEKLKSKGINKLFAQDIRPNAADIQGLGASRTFVRAIYDADRGDVLQPEKVGDSYVVAMVTEVYKKGTQSASVARMTVEPLLRNQKKAELIKKKIGTITTLDAAATALGGKQIEPADSLRMVGSFGTLVSGESRVIGAAFNPANRGKVVPEAIAGNQGVYVVQVNSVSATPLADANVAEQRKARAQQVRMRGMYAQQIQAALLDAADIKDDRSKHY